MTKTWPIQTRSTSCSRLRRFIYFRKMHQSQQMMMPITTKSQSCSATSAMASGETKAYIRSITPRNVSLTSRVLCVLVRRCQTSTCLGSSIVAGRILLLNAWCNNCSRAPDLSHYTGMCRPTRPDPALATSQARKPARSITGLSMSLVKAMSSGTHQQSLQEKSTSN